MNFINELFVNKVLIVSAVAWLVAGICKVIVEAILYKKINIKRIFGAGGMPSSHTSTVIALAISTGYYAGLSSINFAIAAMLAIIVIHDAVGVRLETGKQAKVLNKMIFESSLSKELDIQKLKEYVGHTPRQAFFGGIVGVIVSIVTIIILK